MTAAHRTLEDSDNCPCVRDLRRTITSFLSARRPPWDKGPHNELRLCGDVWWHPRGRSEGRPAGVRCAVLSATFQSYTEKLGEWGGAQGVLE